MSENSGPIVKSLPVPFCTEPLPALLADPRNSHLCNLHRIRLSPRFPSRKSSPTLAELIVIPFNLSSQKTIRETNFVSTGHMDRQRTPTSVRPTSLNAILPLYRIITGPSKMSAKFCETARTASGFAAASTIERVRSRQSSCRTRIPGRIGGRGISPLASIAADTISDSWMSECARI